MKRVYLSFFLLFFLNCFSQQTVNSFPLILKNNRDYFQIVNDSTQEITLFISDKKRVKAILLNKNMQIIDSISTTRPEKKYVDIVGYNKKGSNYRLYWATKNNKELYTELYDFGKKKVTYNTTNLVFKNESIFQKISVNGNFYVITSIENSNILKLYKYGKTGVVEEKSIDVTGTKFYNSSNKLVSFYEFLAENTYEDYDRQLQAITEQSVSSLVTNSKKRKLYVYHDSFVISIDNNPSFTQNLTVNLSDLSFKNHLIPQPYIDTPVDEIPNSNSYIFDSKIIQIKINSMEFAVSIKKLDDGTEINTFSGKKDTEIAFKNSEIIQENGMYDSYRILEKSNQFIRKVNNSTPSITCDLIDNSYYVTLGGISDIVRSSGMGFGMNTGSMGTGLFVTYGPNYAFQNLVTYKEKKVIYVNCLFDLNFNHLQGEPKKLAFEKVRKFVDESPDIIDKPVFSNSEKLYKDVTLFKFGNGLYVGSYNSPNNEYKIFSFTH